MVISADPHIMTIENDSTFLTADIMDFWRPTYSDVAFVDGKFSNEQYLAFVAHVWDKYKEETKLGFDDFAAICFHLPYTKMGLKPLQTILHEGNTTIQEQLQYNCQVSIRNSRQ